MPIVGHAAQQSALIGGWKSGRLHHAWLLAGPKGIGKATFALAAARYILTGGEGDAFDPLPPHPAVALLAAGSHPDFRLVERSENDRGVMRSEIVVEQIRLLQPLFNTTPSFDGWRVVIIDAADELNRNAANAFLKNLEEPPAKTIFFLVSHNPTRLLPTIRSRCRLLRFEPLGDDEVRQVLENEVDQSSSAEIDALVSLAQGSPGRAIRFAGLEIEKLSTDLARIARTGTTQIALSLSRSLSSKSAQPRYEAFVELVPGFIAGEARQRRGASLARAIQLWEKAHALAAEAVPLAYEQQAVVFELAGLVRELGED